MNQNPFVDENGNPIAIPKGGGRDIISQLLGAQQSNINRINQQAQALEDKPREVDLSPILALADHWGGGHLLQGYERPPSDEEKAANIAKLRDMAMGGQAKVGDTILKDIIAGDKNDTMLSRFLAQAGAGAQKTGWVQQLAVNEMMQDAKKDLDIYRSARGAVGQIAKTGVSASRAKTLIDAFSDKKAYPQGMPAPQLAELASSVASMIGSGNVVNQEQINNILPKGLAKDASSLESYLLSQPQGANMQPFVDLLGGTIDREAKTAAKQARALRLRYLPAHRTLYNVAPDDLKKLAAASGLTPEEVDDAFNAKPEDTARGFEEMPVFTDSAPERPSQVSKADWAQATPEEKQAAAAYLGKK